MTLHATHVLTLWWHWGPALVRQAECLDCAVVLGRFFDEQDARRYAARHAALTARGEGR